MPGSWYLMVLLTVAIIPLMAIGFLTRLVWSAGRIGESVKLKRASVEAWATIVGNQAEPRSRTEMGRWHGTSSYRPVLRYETRDGLLIMAPGAMAMPFPFVVGATVPVRYHPGQPTLVEITYGPGAGTDAYRALGLAVLALGVVTVSGCFWGHMVGVL